MRKLEVRTGAGWPKGVYFHGDDVHRVGIVVASELPRDRSTLLVRIMAAGPLLPDAIADLAELPEDANERGLVEGDPGIFGARLGKKPSRTPEEEEFVAMVQGTFTEARRMGRGRGARARRAHRAPGSWHRRAGRRPRAHPGREGSGAARALARAGHPRRVGRRGDRRAEPSGLTEGPPNKPLHSTDRAPLRGPAAGSHPPATLQRRQTWGGQASAPTCCLVEGIEAAAPAGPDGGSTGADGVLALRLRWRTSTSTGWRILVRDGKGRKDRMTMLPERLVAPLQEHLDRVTAQHAADVAIGAGWVELPDTLGRKLSTRDKSGPGNAYLPGRRHRPGATPPPARDGAATSGARRALFVESKLDELIVDYMRQKRELGKRLGVSEINAIALGGPWAGSTSLPVYSNCSARRKSKQCSFSNKTNTL